MTQYDVELIQRIEAVIAKKMELWPTDAEEVALLRERVDEASRIATTELRQMSNNNRGPGGRKRRYEESGGKDDADRDDDVVEAGMPTRKSKKGRK